MSYGTAEKGWKETAVREGLGNHAKKLDPSGESNKQPSQKPGSPADSFCLPHTILKKKKKDIKFHRAFELYFVTVPNSLGS